MNYFSSSSTRNDAVHDRTVRRKASLGCATGAVGAALSVRKCESLRHELSGEPDVGNPHLRFDEGRAVAQLVQHSLLLQAVENDLKAAHAAYNLRAIKQAQRLFAHFFFRLVRYRPLTQRSVAAPRADAVVA